jgi:hypothetical protein
VCSHIRGERFNWQGVAETEEEQEDHPPRVLSPATQPEKWSVKILSDERKPRICHQQVSPKRMACPLSRNEMTKKKKKRNLRISGRKDKLSKDMCKYIRPAFS